MPLLKLYENYYEARFIHRENRFTLQLSLNGLPIKAYLPNTGRLEEYLVPNNPFYIVPRKTARFNYRVIGSSYQNAFVLLDTIKTNEIFYTLISKNLIRDLPSFISISREATFENGRFDFFCIDETRSGHYIEIKTCTLCHNGVALFPDAPSERARHHIELLTHASEHGYTSWMIFLIPTLNACSFIPNFHTDPLFAQAMLLSTNINFRSISISLSSPVMLNLDSVRLIPIRFEMVHENLTHSGSYLLVMKNPKQQTITIGKLGTFKFKEGYYVYVGSALNNLDARIRRHQRRKKSKFWHIDYLSGLMKLVRIYPLRRTHSVEHDLARCLLSEADGQIPGFGASDSPLESHLLYYKHSPFYLKQFISCILDFETFTEI